MTPQKIIDERFPTVGDIVKDPVFIEKATAYIERKKKEREERSRPTLPSRPRYRRTLLDTFVDSEEDFIPAIANVWSGLSKQSSAVRKFLRLAGDGLFDETVMHYFELEKQKSNEQKERHQTIGE